MTTGNYVTNNEYVPSGVTTDPNGQSSVNPDATYNTSNTLSNNFSSLSRGHAYSRLADSDKAKSNPKFNYGSAGRLQGPIANGPNATSPLISRGYIRRSNSNPTDPTDGYRLYFMFNPETIQRDYVAYLEQQALDPFNTIYGSNNLVAPPGILDFSFELFFDRETENANGDMPRGVLEDFDYFDLVVRGVVPDTQGPQLQDNGVMMINPRNITVVFGPQLSVQGRAFRAAVDYTKFDHTMTPTRMTISVSMKVFYFGKVTEDFAFASTTSEAEYEATIPYDQSDIYKINEKNLDEAIRIGYTVRNPGTTTPIGPTGPIGSVTDIPNKQIRTAALQKAESLGESVVFYSNQRPITTDTSAGLDCSGLVMWAYGSIGAIKALDPNQRTEGPWYGYTISIIEAARRLGTIQDISEQSLNSLEYGDIVIGTGHMAFVVSVDIFTKTVYVYESTPFAPQRNLDGPIHRSFSYGAIMGEPNYHSYIIRPALAGNDAIIYI